ncbi:hypothetical protein [Nannocystis pusilla]|uniref:hypothetical protein n=1 Tax=Nannocystis pusilla TaxID=889268 RepID=UPI003DA6C575
MGENESNFGRQVFLIAPDRLVVGSFKFSDDGYVATYAAQGLIWTLQQKLVDPGNSDFGRAIAIDGDRMVVADRDSVYLYTRENDAWVPAGSFDPALQGGAILELALDGDRVVVGGTIDQPNSGGAAWVYEYAGGNWVLEGELEPSETSPEDCFGTAAAIRGDLAVVGAYQSDEFGGNDGAAYIYEREDGAWTRVASLHEKVGDLDGSYGQDVMILGGLVIVGAPQVGDGRVYAYAKVDGAWKLKKTLTHDQNDSASMGWSLGSDGARLIVGAPAYNPVGAARIYEVTQGPQGETCKDAGECASGFCVDGVCCDEPCGGEAPDCLACSVAAGAMVDGTCSVAAAGAVCRAAAGTCDAEETCDGVAEACPKDSFHVAGFECRPALPACNVAETCAGDQAACPADAFAPDGSVCDEGVCQDGTCESRGSTSEGPLTTSDGEDPTTDATTGSLTSGAPTTGEPTTGESPSTTSGPNDPGGATAGATAGDTPTEDSGCGCTATDRSTPLLAALGLLLGLGGQRRRD